MKEEQERLQAQHRVLSLVFDGKLVFPPVPRLRDALDLGYGAATWAIELAEQHPDCEVCLLPLVRLRVSRDQVVGVDISFHMLPEEHPENFEPQVCSTVLLRLAIHDVAAVRMTLLV